MSNLVDLDLANNQITNLPEDFGMMSKLVKLNLSDNKLTHLPMSLGNCIHLTTCHLERNPFEDKELLTVCRTGISHLREYITKPKKKDHTFRTQEYSDSSNPPSPTSQVTRYSSSKMGLNNSAIPVITVNQSPETEDEVTRPASRNKRTSSTPPNPSELRDREKKFRSDTYHFTIQCQEEIPKIYTVLNTSTTIEEILPIARAVRELVPTVKVARKLLPPVEPLGQLIFTDDEDQVMRIRKSVTTRLKEFESILDAIINYLSNNPSFDALIELSGVIASSYAILSDCKRSFK
jgi:hypothetical protein